MEKTIFYSDKIIITQNTEGFVFNFIKEKTDIEDEIDYGFRIGLSSQAAKKFLYVLFSTIGNYEKKNGEIKVNSEIVKISKEKPIAIGFRYE